MGCGCYKPSEFRELLIICKLLSVSYFTLISIFFSIFFSFIGQNQTSPALCGSLLVVLLWVVFAPQAFAVDPSTLVRVAQTAVARGCSHLTFLKMGFSVLCL